MIIAVAAAILTALYWMLRRGTSYQDLGTDYSSGPIASASPQSSPASSTNPASP